MPEHNNSTTRRRAIGLLIRRAREVAGKTRKDAAAFLGVTQKTLTAVEDGQRELSLPQIEALAYYFRAPVTALLDEATSVTQTVWRANIDVGEIQSLRDHIIGVRLRQARQQKGETVKQTAQAAGLSPARLTAYEAGERPIPITELESLMTHLGFTWDELLDVGIGPLGEAQLYHHQHAQFDALPSDVRAFVADPRSLPYLRAAMRLRDFPPEHMRAAGQALIDLSNQS
ncbi:MAG: helix-turn-helix transcriptional regulator [Anaerolineae bacterium]|nr:helix-turn-helix domain-containing protein [Thermoflexales bacterium]MDW8407849.1 helix-turn-helix transcriptional regulator [Anaerolineae bacterium]